MRRYDPKVVEAKWQKSWAENKIYEVTEDQTRRKINASPMLPYPSGAGLHTGHVRNYAIADAVARFYRQNGYNVMSNMGWDAFGLPAENYAIKTGTPPAESTAKNIKYFKEQLTRLGMSYAWEREFNTSDPSYYKWTQWLFSIMYERGLAYQAEKSQWWCDQCKTVLADEQVVAGKCWRHDSPNDPMVTKKSLRQWFFKITDYADRILENTDSLDWPTKIKTMQKNWIGRSEGTIVRFNLIGLGADTEVLAVFTTAVETIYGTTFMVLAPEHPLVGEYAQFADNFAEIDEYVLKAARKSDIEREADKAKSGIALEGLTAINPINGAQIPVWIADYVLMGYGSGAIMAVPGEDARDFEFATKYGLPIIYTSGKGEFVDYQEQIKQHKESFILANSGEFDGNNFAEGKAKIVEKLVHSGNGEQKVHYKIRDWLISRQRYWGAPIPIIHCKEHGAVLVPSDQLPVVLPKVANFAPDGSNHSILAGVAEWVNVPCPTCGNPGKRETDTMDGYVCSAWYLHRYTDANNDAAPFDPAKLDYWFPVDFYFGADHAVAHLLYVRFFNFVLADMGLISEDKKEPIKRLVYNGYINAQDGAKMSKSKGNTVDPMDIINSGYGADALRVFELFIAPYDQDTSWNPNGVPGSYRFLQRIWTLVQEYLERPVAELQSSEQQNLDLKRATHKTVKKVTDDMFGMSFNTAIAAMMEYVNGLYKIKAKDKYSSEYWGGALESIVRMIAPFAPHIAEEMWNDLSPESAAQSSIHLGGWPTYDEQLLVSENVTIVVQINGKVRGDFQMPVDSAQPDIESKAKQVATRSLEGQTIKKTIYITNKLISFVVAAS